MPAGNNGVLPARVSLLVCVLGLVAACDKTPESHLPVSQFTLSQPCDLRQGCRAADASMAVTVTFGAQARALQPFPVHLQLEGDRQADSVSVAFSMQGMDMGSNRYHLLADGGGGWNGDITLPICTSGRTDWVAEFSVVVADRRMQFQLPFVLQK
jgi:hypothetical protein